MAKTFINFADCPFQVNDEVACIHSDMKATVLYVDDEHVFCISDKGVSFYRTWSHELFGNTGGGLKRKHRPEHQ